MPLMFLVHKKKSMICFSSFVLLRKFSAKTAKSVLIQQAAPSSKHETRAAHNKLLVKLKKLSSDCMKLLPEIYEGHETTVMDTNALTKDQVTL